MGPLHSPAQKAFVDEIIQEAKDVGRRRAASSANCRAAT